MASRPIDEKLVVMKLENSDFKNKAAETVGLFSKLKASIANIGGVNLGKVTSEVGNMQRSVDRFNMNSMGTAVDTIASRFTTLGVVATTALTNITNKAMDAGTRLMDSLTTQQVRDGFREYETKIGSIQTILANTARHGTTLDDVQKSLGALNDYADKTIYSFGDMTKNIGLFTNAGLKLEESTSMIKGFSNAAAASGTNAENAARAAYQLSQGLSSGYLMQMDWMSLTNAGMGNDNMKRDLIALGQAMGTLDKSTETTMTNWKDLLSKDKWLTSEVMSTYLQAMAGDLDKATLKTVGLTDAQADMLLMNAKTGEESATMVRTFTQFLGGLQESIGSSWAETWELVFGDFEQATRLWTALSDLVGGIFEKQGKARNDMIRALINSGALEKFGEVVRNVGTPVIQLFKTIGEAFRSVFDMPSSGGIVALMTSFAGLTSHLKMNADTVENLKTIFKGLFAGVSTVIEIVKILAVSILSLLPGFGSVGTGITSLLSKFAEIVIGINEYVKSGEFAEKATTVLSSIFGGLGVVIGVIGIAFKDLASLIGKVASVFKGDITDSGMSEDSAIVGFLSGIKNAFNDLFGFIGSIDYTKVASGISSFFNGISDTYNWVKEKITGMIDFFKNLGPMIMDNQGWILAGGGVAAMGAIIWKAYEVFTAVTDGIKGFGETLEGVGDALGAFTLGIHVKSLFTIALAVGVLAVSLTLLAKLDGKQIATSLTAVVASLGALVGALAIINKANLSGSIGAISSIVGLAMAVSLMSIAITALGNLDTGQATQGVLAISALVMALAGAVSLMSKFGGSFAVGALQFLAIAGALVIMTKAVDMMSTMDPLALIKGVSTIGVLLAELSLFIKIASVQGAQLSASAPALLAVAGSIIIMVKAIEMISNLNISQLVQGLTTIGVLLTSIAVFAKVVSASGLDKSGLGILLMAGALTALVIPITVLGSMPMENLAKGLGSITVALVAFAATAKFFTTAIPGAIAMLLIAGALNALVIPIAAMGQLSWDSILKGVGGLALALLAFGGVAAILGFATPVLIGFSVAIGLIGVGFLSMGAGMSLFAKGLILLTTLTTAAVATIVAAIGAFVTGFTALLPTITDMFMKVAHSIAEVMVKMAPQVADAVYRTMLAILDKIKEYAPQVVDSVAQLILLILEKMKEYVPQFVDIVLETIVLILEKFLEFKGEIVQVILDAILAMLATIEEFVPKFIESGANIIIAIFEGLSEKIPEIIQAMSDFAVTLLESMAATLNENGYLFIDAMLGIMGEVVEIVVLAGLSVIEAMFGWIPGVESVASMIGESASKYIDEHFKAVDIGKQKGDDLASSLEGTSGTVKTAGEAIANAGLTGASSVDFTSAGENSAIGFANGIGSSGVIQNVISSAKSLASTALTTIKSVLDIHSPARETYALGEYTGDGFSGGVASKQKSVFEAILGWGSSIKEGVKPSVKAAETGGTKVGSTASKSMAKGIKKSAPSVKKAAKKTGQDAGKAASDGFNEKMDTLDYKFEMEEINLQQKLDGVKKLRTEYAKYPKLVREANLTIKKIEDDMEKERDKKAKEAIQREKDVNNKRKALIDERKYYDSMSLTQELQAWERQQARYKKGTEERKEADREVYRLKKEIHQKIIDLNEDYFNKVKDVNQKLIDDELAANQKYTDALESRTNDLKSSLGSIFSEVTEKSDLSGRKLMDNLRGQLNTFMSWSHNLRTLANKGIDEGLLDELRQMGPSAASEIAALTTLTNLELQEYSNIWKLRSELARTEAMGELQGLKEDTAKEIEELRKDAKTQLDLYKEEWITKMKEIRYGVPEQFGGLDGTMKEIGLSAMRNLHIGLREMTGPLLKEAQDIARDIAKTVGNALNVKTTSNQLRGKLNETLDELDLTREIVVKAIVETVMPEDDYLKMNTNTLVPDVTKSNQTLNSIKQPIKGTAVPEQVYNANTSKTDESIKGLTSAINSLVDKPQVTQLFVDGKKMTEVVSRNQYNNNQMGAMTKGVL